MRGALDELGRNPELYFVDTDGSLRPAPVANRVQAWTVGAHWAVENGWDGPAGGPDWSACRPAA